jgi:phage terminase large subunit GpA-like protein
MCARCGVGFTQAQYLAVWGHGRWITPSGVWIDRDCVFRSAAGAEIKPPQSVAFSLWTAYSPQATWPAIVREFLQASELKKRGDHTAIKTFTNTTLGQSFKLEGAAHSAAVLQARAKSETYLLRRVPRGGLILVAGVDVQDNRFHIVVWAFGREEEMWVVDRRVMWCDPGAWQSWVDLDVYLSTRFPHEGGQTCAIDCVGVDIGGHYTHQVYRYAMLRESRRVHATQGSSQDGRPIVAGAPTRQDVNVDGQIVKEGVKLWRIGTDTAKDRIFNILRNVQPGPGFMHFSRELESDFFHRRASMGEAQRPYPQRRPGLHRHRTVLRRAHEAAPVHRCRVAPAGGSPVPADGRLVRSCWRR